MYLIFSRHRTYVFDILTIGSVHSIIVSSREGLGDLFFPHIKKVAMNMKRDFLVPAARVVLPIVIGCLIGYAFALIEMNARKTREAFHLVTQALETNKAEISRVDQSVKDLKGSLQTTDNDGATPEQPESPVVREFIGEIAGSIVRILEMTKPDGTLRQTVLILQNDSKLVASRIDISGPWTIWCCEDPDPYTGPRSCSSCQQDESNLINVVMEKIYNPEHFTSCYAAQ